MADLYSDVFAEHRERFSFTCHAGRYPDAGSEIGIDADCRGESGFAFGEQYCRACFRGCVYHGFGYDRRDDGGCFRSGYCLYGIAVRGNSRSGPGERRKGQKRFPGDAGRTY